MQSIIRVISSKLQKLLQNPEVSKVLPSTLVKKFQELQFKLLTKKGTKVAKIGEKIQLPRNKYVYLESYLQMFFNSVSQEGRCNGQNLLFVTGAHRSGKTSLIKQSLQLFKKRKSKLKIQKISARNLVNPKSPEVQSLSGPQQLQFTTLSSPQYLEDLHRQLTIDNQFYSILVFDFNDNFMMKSQAFFHHLHTNIIREIIKLNRDFQALGPTGLKIIDQWIVRDVVLAENAAQFVYVAIKDVVYGILNGCQSIKFDPKNQKQTLDKLQKINQQMIQIDHHQFFGYPSSSNPQSHPSQSPYSQILALISSDKNISNLESSLIFFLSVFRKIQYEYRSKENIQIFQGYQTGIDTTRYLFDILNYLAGFGALNKWVLKRHIDGLDLGYKDYFIGNGNHIDIILSFHHLQKLNCYKTQKFTNWLDTILIHSHSASNFRTHFPIIIQLPDNHTLNEIQRCMRAEVDNPTVMQIPGYYKTNLFRYSPHYIFNQRALGKLRSVLGRNPSTWNQAIQELAKGTCTIPDLLGYNSEFMKQQLRWNLFSNKINRLYLFPQNLPYIDDNSLKYHIFQIMKMFDKCRGSMKMFYAQHIWHIMESPLFQQMYQMQLLYQSYYNTSVDFVDGRDLYNARRYLQNPLGKPSSPNLSFLGNYISYKQWRVFKKPDMYTFFYKQLRYRDDFEVEIRKRDVSRNERSDYILREYYGGLKEYRVMLYDQVYKAKYNL